MKNYNITNNKTVTIDTCDMFISKLKSLQVVNYDMVAIDYIVKELGEYDFISDMNLYPARMAIENVLMAATIDNSNISIDNRVHVAIHDLDWTKKYIQNPELYTQMVYDVNSLLMNK